MAADAAIHGSFNPMVYIVKFIPVGWLHLNLVIEFASGSVDGRVRGQDEKGRVFRNITTVLASEFARLFLLRLTCAHAVAHKEEATNRVCGISQLQRKLVFHARQMIPIVRHPGEGRDPRQQAAILGLS